MGPSGGYTPIATVDAEHDSPSPTAGPSPAAFNAHHIDQLFAKWTRVVGEKMRLERLKRKARRKKTIVEGRDRSLPVPILASVFEVVVPDDDATLVESKGKGKERADDDVRERTLDHQEPMSKDTFDGLVARVQDAINNGIHPKLNSKGSSGSYFAKDRAGTTLGIFKPRDEEPYGSLNPKFTKWVHRVFLARIIPFGRACLIPQLSYISEAGASILDRRLDAHIVPRTEVVSLSSTAFYYDFVDRNRVKSGKKLPPKPGSFQVFLKGFQDASLFLRNHPYPGRSLSQTLDTSSHRQRRYNVFSFCKFICGRADAEDDEDDDNETGWGWGGEDGGQARNGGGEPQFSWTEESMASLREELEKLVILDVLMRNTDRGLDNFMLRPCACTSDSPSITTAPAPIAPMREIGKAASVSSPSLSSPSPSTSTTKARDHFHLAAIDNSLSFPHQHPRGWRLFPYGWLFLPVSLIGQPFSTKTRSHYLPLLSSPSWWAETTLELRTLFSQDPGFTEKMFFAQMAVLKGQAYNIVQSLKDPEEGPLELCRRPKKLVWDDLTEVADDEMTRSLIAATAAPPDAAPPSSIPPTTPPRRIVPATPQSLPILPRARSDRGHAPPSSASSPPSRPVPLKRVLSDHRMRPRRAHGRSLSSALSGSLVSEEGAGSITGMSLMQHLDRVEAEERESRRSLSGGVKVLEEYEVEEDEGPEEDDDDDDNDDGGSADGWGVRSESDIRQLRRGRRDPISFDLERGSPSAVPTRKRSDSLLSLPARASVDIPRRKPSSRHSLSGSDTTGNQRRGWLGAFEEQDEEEEQEERTAKRVVVVERLEPVEEKAFFDWF